MQARIGDVNEMDEEQLTYELEQLVNDYNDGFITDMEFREIHDHIVKDLEELYNA